MNITESLVQYKARKLEQFTRLFQWIRAAATDKPLDSILLQEIDWTRMFHAEVKGNTDKVQKELCDAFLKGLEQLGWGFVLSPKTSPGASVSQQTLMTLYNKSSLVPVDGSDLGVLPSGSMAEKNQRYRGYQKTFTHIKTGKPVDLVNFHLNYEHDHRGDLIQVMEHSIAKGHLVVMGGDANHPPNFAMDTLTGDWHVATAVDKDAHLFKTTGQIVMTTQHVGAKKGIVKHYDGFSAGSPGVVTIVKEAGEHFEVINNQVRLLRDTPNTKHPYHRSEAGYPWMRGRALMAYLDARLGRTSGRKAQDDLLKQMQEIAKKRFNESLDKAALHKKYPLNNVQKLLADPPVQEHQNAVADSGVLQSLQSKNTHISPETLQSLNEVTDHVEHPVQAHQNVVASSDVLQSLQSKNIRISPETLQSLKEVIDRLLYGSTTFNPYYINSKIKLDLILAAVSNLRQGCSFYEELNNTQSELHKAVNMQRLLPFTLFGSFGHNKSKSLMKLNEADHHKGNRPVS